MGFDDIPEDRWPTYLCPIEDQPIAQLALQVVRLRQALGYFVADPRFTIQVGGNPNMVPEMITRAKRIYEETWLEEQKA